MSAELVVVAYDGVDELDLVGVVGPLRKVEPQDDCEIRIVAPGPSVVTSGGLAIGADASPDEVARVDGLVLPGGRGAATVDLGPFEALIRRARADGVPIYCVCTGLLLLARLALLTEDPVAFHHRKHAALRDAGYEGTIVEGAVRHDRLVCVAGRGCPHIRPVALALEIVRDFAGDGAAEEVAARMELESALPDLQRA